MKLSEMKAIKESRENIIGFLHHTEIKAINAKLIDFDCNKKSFHHICDEVIAQYKAKKISNKKASFIFEILMTANKMLRTERFRYDSAYKKIYEYSKEQKAYSFLQNGGKKEYKALIEKFGQYID